MSSGIENDCISFRLEHVIDVLLRSTSIFQDGGQVLGLLRRTLAIVQELHEHEFTTAATPLLYHGARGRLRVGTQAEALFLFA